MRGRNLSTNCQQHLVRPLSISCCPQPKNGAIWTSPYDAMGMAGIVLRGVSPFTVFKIRKKLVSLLHVLLKETI